MIPIAHCQITCFVYIILVFLFETCLSINTFLTFSVTTANFTNQKIKNFINFFICCNLSEKNSKAAEFWLQTSRNMYSLLIRYVRPTLYHNANVYNNSKTCAVICNESPALITQLLFQSDQGKCRVFPAFVVPDSWSVFAGNYLP